MCETFRLKLRCNRVQLRIQCTHLGTFLSGGHWDIGDAYTHTRRLIPSIQLRCAAYHVFQSRRDVNHFIAIASFKANAGFSSREWNPTLLSSKLSASASRASTMRTSAAQL